MQVRFENIPGKKLVGKHLPMSFGNNRTIELWKSFMPLRHQISNPLNSDLISLQLFGPEFNFQNFNPNLPFEKWACVEVSDLNNTPEGIETLEIPGGLYAVFLYKGSSAAAPQTFQYIFGSWLPNSEYELDNRPHFEVIGEKYKNNSPDSEEEIWIPVKKTPKEPR